jgi:YVTN family beta-propeller protein
MPKFDPKEIKTSKVYTIRFFFIVLVLFLGEVILNITYYHKSPISHVAIFDITSSIANSTTTTLPPPPLNAWTMDTADNAIESINFQPGTVSREFGVGKNPDYIALDPTGALLYIANKDSDTVSVMNLFNIKFAPPIAVGKSPVALAFSPTVAVMYVLDEGDNSYLPVNLVGRKPETPVYAGPSPTDMAVDQTGAYAYITDSGDNSVLPVNLTTGKSSDPIPVGTDPTEIKIHNNIALILNAGSDSISVLDLTTSQVVDTVYLPGSPTDVGFSMYASVSYIALGNLNEIVPLNLLTFKISNPIPTGQDPVSIACNVGGNFALVINQKSNSATYIDLSKNQTVRTIALGNAPLGIGYVPTLSPYYS